MGLRGKERDLEDRAQAIAAQTQEDQKLERERAIMRMILDEFARLKASGELSDGDSLAQAVRNVVAAQYADLGEESCKYIADGWIETLRSWSRLEWMVKAGREGPSRA
jgi:class 3 adenylate cyclase